MTTPSIEGTPHRQLIQNCVRIPLKNGTFHYLRSCYRHDYVTFGRGKKQVANDDGLDYILVGKLVERVVDHWIAVKESA